MEEEEMRKSLLAGIAVVGVSVASCGTAFAQSAAAPTVFPMVTQAGKLDGAAPGSVTVSIGGTLFTGLEFQGGSDNRGATADTSPQQLTYLRLYPNLDYAAPDGIHFGVAAEIRNNVAQQGFGPGVAAGASGATPVWYSADAYVSSDKFGKFAAGVTQADAIGTLAAGTGDDYGTGGFFGEWGTPNGVFNKVNFVMADAYFGYIPKQDFLYISPSLGGLNLGVSFQPNSVGANNSSDVTYGTANGGQSRNRIEVAAKYAGSFGPTSLKLSAGYAHASPNPNTTGPQLYDDVNMFTAGAVGSFAGFSLEGSIVAGKWNYAAIDSGSPQGPPPKGAKDSTAIIVGPGYTVGPFAIGAQYYYVNFDASEDTYLDGIPGSVGQTATVNGEALSASYVVAPGVTLELDALHTNLKTPATASSPLASNLHSWGVGIGTYFKW
jgi:hypothetical protein